MWNGKSISLLIPTYKERYSIRAVIEDFDSLGIVDEIIVVNNNAEAATDEEVRKTRAKLLYEKRQGYGYTLQMGLRHASGDYVVTVEPDGTYIAADLERFLIFAKHYPAVFGSRTIRKTTNKDWGFWRREVNILYGLLIHLLFNTNMITDIGCTYKLMHREAIERLKPEWRHGSSLFATELLLLVVAKGIDFIETPVTFQERVGGSTVIPSNWRLFKLGLLGLWQIFDAWVRWGLRRLSGRLLSARRSLTSHGGP